MDDLGFQGMHSHADQLGWSDPPELVHHVTEVGRIVARYIADTTSFDVGNARVKAGMASTAATGRRSTGLMRSYSKYGVLAVGVAALSSVKAFAQFQKVLNVFDVTAEATNKQMKQASALAQKLGRDVRFPGVTARDSADALLELAKGGLDANKSMAALEATLLLGTAGELDYGEAAEIMANSINTFNLKGKDAMRIANLLSGAAISSSGDVKDMAKAFQYAAAQATTLGMPMEDLTVLIAQLAKGGLKGAMGGTSARMFLTSLTGRSKKAKEILEELKIKGGGGAKGPEYNRFFDEKGEIKSIEEIMKVWRDATKGLSKMKMGEIGHVVFGVRGMNVAAKVLRANQGEFDKLSAKTRKAGNAQRLASAQTKDLVGAQATLQNSIQSLQLSFGEALAPTAKRVLNTLELVFGALADRPGVVKALTKGILVLTGVWAAMTMVKAAMWFGGVVKQCKLARVAVLAFRGAVLLARAAMIALRFAFLTSPFGWIALAIIAIVLVLRKLGVSFNDVKREASMMWAWIKSVFTGAYNWVKNWLTKNWKTALLVAITGPFGLLVVIVRNKWGTIKRIIGSIVGFLTNLAGRVYGAAKGVGESIKQGVLDGLGSITDAIEDKLGIPGWARGSGIELFKRGAKAAGMAGGGPVYRGRPYIVGERGPELFVPRRSGGIVPNGAMAGGPSVTIEHMSVRAEDDIYSIASVLGRKLNF